MQILFNYLIVELMKICFGHYGFDERGRRSRAQTIFSFLISKIKALQLKMYLIEPQWCSTASF